MGKLTCVAMCGFLCLHLAVIMVIVALGTPEWIIGCHNITADDTNRTSVTQGLWRTCNITSCRSINQTAQHGWLHGVQGLQVSAALFGLIALVITYVIHMSDTGRVTLRTAVANFAMQGLSALCVTVAVAIFAVEVMSDALYTSMHPGYTARYYWGFYMDVAAAPLMSVSALFVLKVARYHCQRYIGYEDIYS